MFTKTERPPTVAKYHHRLRAYEIEYWFGATRMEHNKHKTLVIAYTTEQAVQYWREEMNKVDVEIQGPLGKIITDPRYHFQLGDVKEIPYGKIWIVPETETQPEI